MVEAREPSLIESRVAGLMEDLKAGVPRTGYRGIVMLRMNGKRVFLAPSYRVEQDITVDGHGLKPAGRG